MASGSSTVDRSPARHRGILAWLLTVAVVASVAGCSSSSESGTTSSTTSSTTEASGARSSTTTSVASQTDYAAALTGQLQKSDGLGINDAQAACLGPAWIEVFGVDRLRSAKIAPDKLSDGSTTERLSLGAEDGDALVDAMAGCGVDIQAFVVTQLGARRELSEEQRSCLVAAATPNAAKAFLAASFLNATDPPAIVAKAQACLGS